MEKNKKKKGLSLFSDPKKQKISIPILSIVLSLIAGSLVILLVGKNPLDAYKALLQGSGFITKPKYAGGTNILTDFSGFLDALAPMIFAALAVIVAMKAGLFNIGVSGQMLLAGFIATVTIGYSDLNHYLAKPLVVVIGFIMGALAGGFIGFLKYRFNINEVVSSIMLNNIFSFIISYFINTRYVDPVSRQSNHISKEASLTLKSLSLKGIKVDLPLGIILALLTSFIIYRLLEKTTLGYEIKAVGFNKKAANYAGIDVDKTILKTMFISGGLAGLAGVTYYLGYFSSIQPKVLSSLGFDAIATALLANNNPIGAIFSSILVTILSKGSVYMSSNVGVVKEISGVITSLILLFSATSLYMKEKINKKTSEKEIEKRGGAND